MPGGRSANSRDVAAAKHDVLGGHRVAQQAGPLEYGGAPARFAERCQAALAQQVFEGLILERQVGELQRDDRTLVDQGGAES